MIHMRKFNHFEEENLRFLVNLELEFALVQTTATGIHKSILDAIAPIRKYLKKYKFHDYDMQSRGENGKCVRDAVILTEKESVNTKISLYKPETKKRDDPSKGDTRFWIYKLARYTGPDDINLLFCHENILYAVNISRINVAECFENAIGPIKNVVTNAVASIAKIADELLKKFREIEGQWIQSEVNADTGIGRTVETLLGIQMNSSKDPDYKGIELKSFRERRPSVKKGLFSKTPNWALSKKSSGVEIADAYGKDVGREHKTLHHTVECPKPNSFNLRLNVNYAKKYLEIEEDKKINPDMKYSPYNFQKVDDVVAWELETLHHALLNKHKETFWIEVDSKIVNGVELFKIKEIEHTKNPVISQFDTLIEQGEITVELLLSRSTGGDTYSFKIKKRATSLLFPERKIYKFR